MAPRHWLIAGSVVGFFAVAAGAFGAHALKGRLEPDMLAVFEIGNRYAMYHALALLAVGFLATRLPPKACSVAGWSFLLGTIVFSGTLWLLAVSGMKWLGMITPLGGLALMVGWVAFAMAARRLSPSPQVKEA